MLQQLSKIELTVTPKAKPEAVTERAPLYQTQNEDTNAAYFSVLGDPEQLEKYADRQNIIHSYTTIDKEIGTVLRQKYGNKAVLLCEENEVDFDLCDALTAQNFQLFIGNQEAENRYRFFITRHYTFELTEENRIDQLNELCLRISFFQNALERDDLVKVAAKISKVKTASLLKTVNDFISGREEDVQELQEGERPLPKWINTDQYYKYGFDWACKEKFLEAGLPWHENNEKTGIYFSGRGEPWKLTNFVIKPLFHIEGEGDDNRRFTELDNGYYSPIVELPTKAFTSLEFFNTLVSGKGNFYTIDGFSSSHLNRLKAFFLKDYPKSWEMTKLGWQHEGFFSYSDMVYHKQLMQFDKHGLIQVDDVFYLSMSASNVLEGIRAEDNIYRNDKYLTYMETELTFRNWCKLMTDVYPEHGMMGVSWCFLAAFKDVVFKRNNSCPIPYAYGAVQAGKSKFVESVCNLFTHEMPMFNMNQGTDFAFFERMERFRNVPVGFNEFDENTIKEEWFRAMKGAFDGEGRAKGSGRRSKTKTQEINCLPILIGQYLSSKDDNSVLMRSLPCKFTEGRYTDRQISSYNTLKAYEKKGITSLLCEILAHREYVAENYNLLYEKINSGLKEEFKKEGLTPKTRVLENYTAVLTLFKLLTAVMDTGLSYAAFYTYCKNEIAKMSTILTESNSLSEFWKVVEFLLDQDEIEQGYHFKVEALNEVRLHAEAKKTRVQTFAEPKKVMFLRMNTIHALYMQTKRQQTGKPGLNEQTILTYLKDQDYYIGTNPSSQFRDSKGNVKNTSSYVLDYDLIGVSLERFKEETGETATLNGRIWKDAEVVDILGVPKLSFKTVEDKGYQQDGHAVKNDVFTNCLFTDLRDKHQFKQNRMVEVTGRLSQRHNGYRDMQVTDVKFLEVFVPVPDTEAADEIFGKENQL